MTPSGNDKLDRRRRIVLAVASTLVAVAAVVALWSRLRPGPPPVARGKGGEYNLSFVDPDGRAISKQRGTLKLMLDPFTLFRNMPNQSTRVYRIDERGFRGTYEHTKPLIALLGGSAAFGQPLASDEETLAARLAARAPGFEVLNAGVVGYLSGQELAQMVHVLDDLHPAAYVVFDGWNDLFDQYLAVGRRAGEFGFNNAFFVIASRLVELATSEGVDTRAHRERPPVGIGPSYLRRITETYVANLSRMHAFATARRVPFLAVFQPELGAKRTRNGYEDQVLAEWETTTRYRGLEFSKHYARMGVVAARRCKKAGIPFLDLNAHPRFRDGSRPLYFDVVHLTAEGHDLAAEVISETLRTLLQGTQLGPASTVTGGGDGS